MVASKVLVDIRSSENQNVYEATLSYLMVASKVLVSKMSGRRQQPYDTFKVFVSEHQNVWEAPLSYLMVATQILLRKRMAPDGSFSSNLIFVDKVIEKAMTVETAFRNYFFPRV